MGIAGIPFEDEKISFEQLVEKRGPKGRSASIPLGSLPVMTLPDGKVEHPNTRYVGFKPTHKTPCYTFMRV